MALLTALQPDPSPSSQTLPSLATPIDFLVYEASPSLCVYSLSGLASLRAPPDTTCPYPARWPKPSHTYIHIHSWLFSQGTHSLFPSPTDLESMDSQKVARQITCHTPHLTTLPHCFRLIPCEPQRSQVKSGTLLTQAERARAAKSSPKENPNFQVSSEKGFWEGQTLGGTGAGT